MNDSISPLELLELLRPKIQKELQQTDLQNRADLEQEIILKILEDLKLKNFQELPSFFELLEKERSQK
ncbi:hypothetical protein [Lysinibacillus odysseyi]|uniref:Uncharacterized protein n=1 Tax=Lysinibacillus odysseyi 34hs-1 = NBRC 100172 TaxID=1220589 RepID=A0A0A3IN45_9BACI|nr:hypothetical protein [Lysinibacillus odysseyi]KGR86171.1 hypothetical protein CD32_07190 [Lysinibacillus odysseyi 34hs-1 = NBRC 100172]